MDENIKTRMKTMSDSRECQTLDVQDAALELGVCRETIPRLVRRKVLRKLPEIRSIRIPRTEIERYLAGFR